MTESSQVKRLRSVLLFRFLVAALLIWFVTKSFVKLEEVPETLASVSLPLFGVSFALFMLTKAISAYRLQFVFRAFGNESLSFPALLGNVFRGVFLNTTSVMGLGDAYRVHDFKNQGVSLKNAALVVVFDRLLGVAGLGALAVLLNLHLAGEYWLQIAVSLSVVGGLTLATRNIIASYIQRLISSAVAPAKLSGVALLTLLNANVIILQFFVLSRAVQLSFEPMFFWQRAPFVFIATALPFSIGGVGVRELALEYLMSSQAETSAQLLLMGLLQFATMALTVAVSLIFMLRGRRGAG